MLRGLLRGILLGVSVLTLLNLISSDLTKLYILLIMSVVAVVIYGLGMWAGYDIYREVMQEQRDQLEHL